MHSRFIGKLKPGIQGYLAPCNAGKTQIMLHDAVDLARDGHKVTVISGELAIEFIVDRIKKIAGDDFKQVSKYITVKCVEIGKLTVSEIVTVVKSECDVCIVDFLGLCHNSKVPMSIWLRNIMSTLDHFAKLHGKSIITSVQMNREGSVSNSVSTQEESLMSEFSFNVLRRTETGVTVNGGSWDIFSCLIEK